MNNTKRIFITAISLFVSLITVLTTSHIFFPNNSPVIRQHIGNYLASELSKLTNRPVSNDQTIAVQKTVEDINNIVIKTSAKGVYASPKDSGRDVVIYRKDEVEWVKYTYFIKNKDTGQIEDLVIQVPKGSQPPSQKLLEE